jgi:arylsulfatase A-like enzyme
MRAKGISRPGALLSPGTVLLAVAALLASVLSVPPAEAAKPKRANPQKRPNIVLIVTDDQRFDTLAEGAMPRTERLLGRRGAIFTEAIVTTPLCCPSRATMLTGQYGHNNGVLRNRYGLLRAPRNVLPVWLRKSGYVTAHVGRWLNHYVSAVGDPERVAPGWKEWHTIVNNDDSNLRYFGYRLRVNGGTVKFGKKERDHLTREIQRRSLRILDRYLPKRKPLYLQIDHLAPHSSPDPRLPCRRAAKPLARDVGRFDDREIEGRVPSFDHFDPGKHRAAREEPPWDEDKIARSNRGWRCGLASLLGVDRGIERIVKRVRKHRELGKTVFIFTSDNGYFLGEHRLGRKGRPYEEGVRVPLLVRMPPSLRKGAEAGMEIDLPVANVDLPATILQLARAKPCLGDRCRTLDGRSLLPLLRGRFDRWPEDRAILIEMSPREAGQAVGGGAPLCAFRGLRTPERAYYEFAGPDEEGRCPQPLWADPEPEYYDLEEDPFQLNATPAPVMAERLERLASCAGIEGRDTPPPGRFNCE